MMKTMPVTPIVKRLMIITVSVWFVLQILLGVFFKLEVWQPLALFPNKVVENFYVWQLFTYIFLHAISPFHLAFNMLMLWFFGSELERLWGHKFFLSYYLISGVGAALIYCTCVVIYSLVTGIKTPMMVPVIGSSGALFGLLTAYGIIFAEREMYFMGLFPMKAKYFVMLIGAIDFASLLGTGFSGSEVAYLAHLGGIVAGFTTLTVYSRYKAKKVGDRLKRKNTSLRLVVDNDKDPDKDKPKYWN